MNFHAIRITIVTIAALAVAGCFSSDPAGLAPAAPASTTVKYDFFHKPLPEIPLPNDLATRYDESSATGLRLNASMIAPTFMEQTTRQLFDELDGWGVYSAITVPFTRQLDIDSIRDGHCIFEADDPERIHCDFDKDVSDDVIMLINVDRDSSEFGRVHHLDVGNGNFPVVVEDIEGYWGNDSRGFTQSILFEEADEDTNGNGRLDPGEDTDSDGILDKPNYLPGHNPAPDDLRGRADALMTFYERETATLIARPMMPLEERTTYAVVITRRLLDADGEPVGSPFQDINHTSQTKALEALPEVLPAGTELSDVAFAFSFTTQSVQSIWEAVRDGLYGHGVQGHLASQFPAEVKGLFEIATPDSANPYILFSEEWFGPMELIAEQLLGANPEDLETQFLIESHKYIDYHVIGTFESPQLFHRGDDPSEWGSLNEQSWPNDLDARPATARAEDIHFWLMMPRREVSPRGENKPVPVAILIHGYGSNRFEAMSFAGFFAKHGIALLAIDAVSHGIGLDPEDMETALDIMDLFGLKGFLEAALSDRGYDQNGDGMLDSAADFWTSYLFHTRDVVRQSALDHLQLIRILQTFDGTNTWSFDLDGDGSANDIAGDFDGDGHVDIGKGSFINLVGGSLGGIMSTVIGGIEPHVDAIVPIAGGGGLFDIGLRSKQGGVREAVILRLMGPVYTGDLDKETGELVVSTIVPDLNDDAHIVLGTVEGVSVGDTLYAKNLDNGVVSCGVVSPDGTARAHLESDKQDRTTISVYKGNALEFGEDCPLSADAELVGTVDRFVDDIAFQWDSYDADSPLVAIAEGMGRRRASPSMRRSMMLSQIALDQCDPAVHAEYLLRKPFVYPGTGERTGAHAMVVTTMGDMNVPASSGANLARAAGLIDFLEDDPRYGKSPNQVLIDNGAFEAVHTISRFQDIFGNPVHIDIENFADDNDVWAGEVPRLDPPLRLHGPDTQCGPSGDDCGVSGALFPFPRPDGQHGFAFPGRFIQDARKKCTGACAETGVADPCGCKSRDYFDIGAYMFNVLGDYMASGGKRLNLDMCNSDASCDHLPAPPELRPMGELR